MTMTTTTMTTTMTKMTMTMTTGNPKEAPFSKKKPLDENEKINQEM